VDSRQLERLIGDGPDCESVGRKDAVRPANELTLTQIDPVSKQPLFKLAAVQIS
jgi:hypothetical protein